MLLLPMKKKNLVQVLTAVITALTSLFIAYLLVVLMFTCSALQAQSPTLEDVVNFHKGIDQYGYATFEGLSIAYMKYEEGKSTFHYYFPPEASFQDNVLFCVFVEPLTNLNHYLELLNEKATSTGYLKWATGDGQIIEIIVGSNQFEYWHVYPVVKEENQTE